ncbi:zinc finger protein 26-like [Sitodiplosis mosellana]|uniref:zinc finger protein 26-like n=1 Tax=Sitodiplosis mosellana TaxID=263140 RepID=UPI002444DACF|nr:zinc finger protein 26-like [Sitodiplosis mosellana]
MSDEVIDTKCLRCNLNFTSAKKLKIHQLEKHAQGVVKCFKCRLKFSTQDRFRVHWNNKHVTAPKTPAEPKPSSSSNDQTVNLDGKSEGDSQKSSTAVTAKKRTHVGPTSNRCTVCFKAFASHQFAKLHYERVHMDWTTECEVCQKRVKKNLYIKVHLAKHRLRGEISVERILEIQKENQKMQKRKSSNGELNVKVQPNVPTKCPDCLKVFISDRVMKIHWARVHYVATKKENAGKERDKADEKSDPVVPEKEPKACPQCNKMFETDGRMRIHYFQAHVKKTLSKPIRKKKLLKNKQATCTTYPSIKSISDLRSKPPDVDFDSNTCPMCKKVFSSNSSAKKHFKVVHRQEEIVKCPYPQCFTRCSTVQNLRTHFSNHHPKATLPKEFEPTRIFVKKQKHDDKNSTDGNKSEMNASDKCENTPEQDHQEDAKKSDNGTKVTKPNNPLLKMFEKMREKNAQCPVVPLKVASEVIEIEEDQSGDNGGCFTLDFEHCSVCSRKFPTREAAMLHYNNKHSDEIQMCPECEMLVTNSRQMPYHFKTKHPTIVMPLYLKSSRRVGFTKELFDQFNLNKCTTCQQVFNSKGHGQRHFLDEHEIKFELCSICMRSFRSEAALLTHWAHSHENSKFVEFEAQTPMEVDDQGENATKNVIENEMENRVENLTECLIENTPGNTTEADDVPITDSDVPTSTNLVTTNKTAKATNANSSKKNRKNYPFITSNMCPICNRQCLSRKSTVLHYRTVHTKNGITCQMCVALFANIDHLKQHWLEVHKDAPWKYANPVLEIREEKKTQNEAEDVELNIGSNKENEINDKTPKMSVVVSLVNIKDNLDSLSPDIFISPDVRKQFLELSKEMDKATTDPNSTENEEKVSDSGHGSTADTTDEEISVELSQNEPLDLSTTQHDRSPTDDLLDRTLIKCETVNIKYESSDHLVSSFNQAIFSSRTKKTTLTDDTDIIVKDEITFEESMIEE